MQGRWVSKVGQAGKEPTWLRRVRVLRRAAPAAGDCKPAPAKDAQTCQEANGARLQHAFAIVLRGAAQVRGHLLIPQPRQVSHRHAALEQPALQLIPAQSHTRAHIHVSKDARAHI